MLVDDICDFALLVSSESNLFKKVRVKLERPLYLLSLQYCKSVFTIFNKVLKPMVMTSRYLICNNFIYFRESKSIKRSGYWRNEKTWCLDAVNLWTALMLRTLRLDFDLVTDIF